MLSETAEMGTMDDQQLQMMVQLTHVSNNDYLVANVRSIVQTINSLGSKF